MGRRHVRFSAVFALVELSPRRRVVVHRAAPASKFIPQRKRHTGGFGKFSRSTAAREESQILELFQIPGAARRVHQNRGFEAYVSGDGCQDAGQEGQEKALAGADG